MEPFDSKVTDETPTARTIRLIQEEARAPLLAENERLRQWGNEIFSALEAFKADNTQLSAENERLRAEGLRFATWIDEVYSSLPRDRPPGPPITLLREMRAVFGAKSVEFVQATVTTSDFHRPLNGEKG